MKINSELVEAGALLHDIGRSKTHTVNHAVVGAEIAKAAELPDSVVSIIKRPKDVYMPVTLEEKIVSYADKLIENSKRAPITITIEKLDRELKHEAAERVRKLHEEITGLMSDNP